jgi:hypothetical protein
MVYEVPALVINSPIAVILFVLKSALVDELTFVHPFLAPMRPYWSITQLTAVNANPLAKSKDESWVFNP